MRPVLLCALLVASASAADPVVEAADAVLAVFRAKGDLRAIAEEDDPDPWLVADALCARGEHEAAEAFAKAAPRVETERLPAYVASRRGLTDDGAARRRLAGVDSALASGDAEGAVALAGDAPPTDVATIQLAFGRGLSLRDLRRLEESAAALLLAAGAAEKLGWLAKAAEAYSESGASARSRSDYRGALACWESELAVHGRTNDREKSAWTLRNMGIAHAGLEDYPSALSCGERARKLMEELKDREGAAWTLVDMGNVHVSLEDYPKALSHLERALEILEECEDRAGIAWTLGSLGLVHRSLGDDPKALSCHERALKLMEELGDQVGIATALRNLGGTLDSLEEYPKALSHFERALKLMREMGDREGAAWILLDIGRVHASLDEHAEALSYSGRALKLMEELACRGGVAAALRGMSEGHKSLDDYPKAISCLERALTLMEELGYRDGVAEALRKLGSFHAALRDNERAFSYRERALKAMEELGDRVGVSRILGNMGNAHFSVGEYPEALSCMERSLGLMGELGLREEEATMLGNIGAVHRSLGDYPKALSYLERALRLNEELKNRGGEARTLGNIGGVHYSVGDYARALSYMERALKLAEEMEDRSQAAYALGNIGSVHFGLRDYRTALSYKERVLELLEELKDERGVAHALGDIGSVYYSLGDYTTALIYKNRTLRLMEEIKDRAGQAWTLQDMGTIHDVLREYGEARSFQERALQLSEEIGARDKVVRSLGRLASLHLDCSEPDTAARLARRAVEEMRGLVRGLGEEQGAMARDQFSNVFAVGARAGAQMRAPSEVAFFLESGRAGSLLETLVGREALRATAIPEELRMEEASARAAESRAVALLGKAVAAGNREEVKARHAESKDAREKLMDVIARIQREAKRAADVLYPRAKPLGEIRGGLREGEALVLYGLFREEALALVITKSDARIVALGAGIEKAIEAFRADDPRTDPSEALKALSRLAIDPLGLDAKTPRVLVSPDGALAEVPFALLLPGREVAYVPSGTTYLLLREDAGKKGAGILALADPDYGRKADLTARAIFNRGGNLIPLPATREEAKAVADTLLLGKDATEAGLRAALGTRPRWRAVHLACHGLVDAERPMFSSLAVTPEGEDDGFLRTLEVFQMSIPADLVVLSACETARGKAYKAEGVVGFTRAFLFAGTPRVIVSLWKVDDEATKALMVKFYAEWGGGAGAAAALRKAQESVRSQERWKHPAYWAAWQLWGLPE